MEPRSREPRGREEAIVRKSRLRSAIAAALALSAVLAAAAPAAALSKAVIRPEKLTPVNRQVSQGLTPVYVGSLGATPATFWAPLKLPLGARIKGLVYYHWGDGTHFTNVMVTRAKVGQPLSAADIIFYNQSNASVSLASPPVTMTMMTKNNPSSDTLVRPGYRYFIFVTSEESHSLVGGVKVLYQP